MLLIIGFIEIILFVNWVNCFVVIFGNLWNKFVKVFL